MKRLVYLLLLINTLYGQNLFMGEFNDESTIKLLKDNENSIQKSNEINNLSKTEEVLKNIYINLEDKKLLIEHLELKLQTLEDKAETEQMLLKIEKEKVNYAQIEKSLVQLSVGSVDVKDLQIKDSRKKVNLEQSIDDIFEPFAIMLMRFTQTPRAIENITLEIQSVDAKIDKLNLAIKTLNSYKTLSAKLKFKINTLADEYSQKRLTLIHKQNSLSAQLFKLENSKDEPVNELFKTIVEFLSTHGLTFFYALSAFLVVTFLLFMLKGMMSIYFEPKDGSSTVFTYRLINMLLSISSIVLSISFALIVIYWRSDWLMLAIIIFFIFLALWSLKNAIPKYIDEMFLILNVGIIREKEYVEFNGIPFIVKEIGIFATLINEKLSNSKVRITLNELEKLTSRELVEKEEIFPTNVGDFIFIEKNYGQILFQSPSIVEMNTFGEAIKTYQTSAYLSLKPTNISKSGFTIIVNISLDYKHQQIITSSIVSILEKGINRTIDAEIFSSSLKRLWVEFSEAKISSLDLKVLATFNGEVAGDYYHIERTIRRSVVDVCNKNGWKLPFPQLEIRNAIS